MASELWCKIRKHGATKEWQWMNVKPSIAKDWRTKNGRTTHRPGYNKWCGVNQIVWHGAIHYSGCRNVFSDTLATSRVAAIIVTSGLYTSCLNTRYKENNYQTVTKEFYVFVLWIPKNLSKLFKNLFVNFCFKSWKRVFLKSTSRNKKMNKDTLMNIKIQSESGGLIEGQ